MRSSQINQMVGDELKRFVANEVRPETTERGTGFGFVRPRT